MNTTTPEQFAAAYQSNLETMFVMAHTTFAGVERLVELNLNALRANLQEGAGKTRTMMGLKDPQELISFQAAQFQPAAEKAAPRKPNSTSWLKCKSPKPTSNSYRSSIALRRMHLPAQKLLSQC
jgi:hypothetical protein